ncbi:hypothetical protein NX761_11280 [Nitrosomonas sp. PLL12]|nr:MULTISPECIES: hypothetical protein [Nitrosomonas]UVS60108.1 hypothetical protein NX761_11280 [Nitrosomonas sp. PLL12]
MPLLVDFDESSTQFSSTRPERVRQLRDGACQGLICANHDGAAGSSRWLRAMSCVLSVHLMPA